MRHPLVMGNWKLNGSTHMVNDLIAGLRNELSSVDGCDVAIAPPAIYLTQAKHALAGSRIALGAQNVDVNLSGAFTGETSAEMLKDIGAKYIIIGHSERRTYHKESDEFIAKKFAVLKEQGLVPVLCIGESEAENEAGKTEEVCARQIDAVLNTLGAQAFQDAVIAYEPIWAIGTGKSATPAQAQAVHKFIRDHIAKKMLRLLRKSSSNTVVQSMQAMQQSYSLNRISMVHLLVAHHLKQMRLLLSLKQPLKLKNPNNLYFIDNNRQYLLAVFYLMP